MSWARKIRAGKLDEVVSRYDYLCHQLESQRLGGYNTALAYPFEGVSTRVDLILLTASLLTHVGKASPS